MFDVPAGETYFIDATHKLYRFDTKVINLSDDMADVNLTPIN
jgi:hypothetical protein